MEREPRSDSERLANYSRQVLAEQGVDTTNPEIARALTEIAAAGPEEAAQLVMDLMGNAGLEPDDAFAEVMAGAEVGEVLPSASERIAAITGAALESVGVHAPDELQAIAQRSGHGALGTAAELLVSKGACASTQDAMLIIDPDGSLEEEVSG